MERKQFTFYRSYFEALKTLPKKERETVVMAICAYALDEEEPTLSGVSASCFTLIRPTLDSGRNKAKNRCGKVKTKQEQNKNKPEEMSKEKEVEREVENDSYISPGGDIKQAAIAAVMSAYLDKITPTPSQRSLEELKGYVELMGQECCLRAIDIALDEKVAKWSYIRKILETKASQGVRCIADWDRLETERNERLGKTADTGGTQGKGQGRDWGISAVEL